MDLNLMMNLGAVILFLVVLAFLYYLGKKKEVYHVIYAMVLEAEEKFGSGTGELKYEYVVGRVYPLLPTIIRFFITKKDLDRFIELSVDRLQEQLIKYRDKEGIKTLQND